MEVARDGKKNSCKGEIGGCMKRVSIIMPCYNDGNYILESIDSALNQSYSDIELIIVDDGSTDEKTLKVLDEIKNRGIRVIKSRNQKPAAARNLGIENATGEYILPLDSDDLIEKDYVEKAVFILENDINVGAVYCKADLFGTRTGIWDLPDYSLDKMLLDNIVFVTAVFRKEDWKKVGGFNTKLVHGMEDYDFWLSILEMDKEIVQIPEILFHYRIKEKSRTSNFMDDISNVKSTYQQIYCNHPKLFQKYADKYCILLRNALIEHIFLVNKMKKSVLIIEKLSSVPILKKIIRKYILKSEAE